MKWVHVNKKISKKDVILYKGAQLNIAHIKKKVRPLGY